MWLTNDELLSIMTKSNPSIVMEYTPLKYDNSFFINGLSKFNST